jgi:hypothetical protein
VKTKDFPQLELMRAGVDYSFKISLRKYEIMVRPLTNLEIIDTTSKAAEAYEKLPEKQQMRISLSLLNAMYQLERAASPDIGEESPLSLAVLQMMNPEEVNHLWKQYVRVVDMVNPDLEKLTVEQLDAMVSQLKKNSDPISLLTDLSISNLIEVCLRLLQEAKESPLDS